MTQKIKNKVMQMTDVIKLSVKHIVTTIASILCVLLLQPALLSIWQNNAYANSLDDSKLSKWSVGGVIGVNSMSLYPALIASANNITSTNDIMPIYEGVISRKFSKSFSLYVDASYVPKSSSTMTWSGFNGSVLHQYSMKYNLNVMPISVGGVFYINDFQQIAPFFTVGGGAGKLSFSDISINRDGDSYSTPVDESHWVPFFKAGLGIQTSISSNVKLEVKYSHVVYASIDVDAMKIVGDNVNIRNHIFSVGVSISL